MSRRNWENHSAFFGSSDDKNNRDRLAIEYAESVIVAAEVVLASYNRVGPVAEFRLEQDIEELEKALKGEASDGR